MDLAKESGAIVVADMVANVVAAMVAAVVAEVSEGTVDHK